MKKEMKNLTIKYFLQQKVIEIFLALIIIASIIFLPYYLGSAVGNNGNCYVSRYGVETINETLPFSDMTTKECTQIGGHINEYQKVIIWLEGAFYVFILTTILFVLLMIMREVWYLTKVWIISNWEKAQKRAKKKLG